jgi:hypothetical protein
MTDESVGAAYQLGLMHGMLILANGGGAPDSSDSD